MGKELTTEKAYRKEHSVVTSTDERDIVQGWLNEVNKSPTRAVYGLDRVLSLVDKGNYNSVIISASRTWPELNLFAIRRARLFIITNPELARMIDSFGGFVTMRVRDK